MTRRREEPPPQGRLSRLFRRWLATAIALLLTAELVPGVALQTFWPDAFIVAVVLGLLSALVRPLLVTLTLPLTVLTLGLFLVVIHAALLGLAAWLTDGLAVADAPSALLGALVLSMASGVLSKLLGVRAPPRRR